MRHTEALVSHALHNGLMETSGQKLGQKPFANQLWSCFSISHSSAVVFPGFIAKVTRENCKKNQRTLNIKEMCDFSVCGVTVKQGCPDAVLKGLNPTGFSVLLDRKKKTLSPRKMGSRGKHKIFITWYNKQTRHISLHSNSV